MRQVLPNAGTTGTTVNTLTKITGNPSTLVIAAITDTSGVLGITVSGAGTTGNATIQLAGPIPCVFDGATTAGDYVQISSSVAGNCHDAGATFPTGNQVIGRVQSTNGSGGTYTINLYPAEINATAGSGGSVASVFGRVGIVVSATNDYNFNQLAGSAACSQEPALTGDTTSSAGSCATTTSGINGTAFSGTNGDVVSFGASNTPADSGIPAANVVTQTSNAASGQICTYTGTNKVCVPSAALPNGVTATTQAASDNSTKVATTAYADRIAGGAGTVTSIATTSPIGGGTITGTGTLTCATCVVASSPGAGIARFAGSTQTVTSAELSGDVTTSGSNVTTVANVAGTAAATVKIRDFGTTFGDTAGSALTSGSIVYFTVPYACTIAAWNITVDAGTVTFDIWKIATGSAVPTVSNSITASAQPAISSGTAVHSTTMTGWGAGTTVTANDIFGIQLKTVATAKFAELDIQCNQ
jgi:hypothetical protein